MLKELFGREEREQPLSWELFPLKTPRWLSQTVEDAAKVLVVQELWEARKKEVVSFPGPNPKLTELQECPPKKYGEIHKEEDPLHQGTFRYSLLTPQDPAGCGHQ